MAADWTGAIERARAHSPFLSMAMERLPDLTALLAAGEADAALEFVRTAGVNVGDVGAALRRERMALALALGIGDLAGAFPLATVTGELSALADRAMDAAITDAIRRRVPDAEPAGFIALALGKHGARELNYSSDIDPILLYDPESLPRRERDEPGEAAQRIARTLVKTLAQATEEGYVFRVDLRLRPAAEVSPLAISVDAALCHYESSALAWERAAFIRARTCAGDIAAGEEFLAAIRPFIWRKSLDFGAIAEIGRLTAQIRASHKGTGNVGPGFDLKRGRGGIREVEFYAQTHQLIHGGRDPSLRCQGTRETLDALAVAGLILSEDAQILGDSYDRLRMLEHRLQMVSDQQTHSLPSDATAIEAVARLDGLAGGPALIAELQKITEAVGQRYDQLLDAGSQPSGADARPASEESLEVKLERLGFADPTKTSARIAGWRDGRFRTLRSEAALRAFAAIQPELLAAFAAAPEPERALLRWEQLLGNLPSAINLFHLLEARPALLDLLARILALAPPLADELTRRADLLDPLIDASAFELPGSVEELAESLAGSEIGDDFEQILDSVRRRVGELRFALGVQLIDGVNDPLDIAQGLARVAEAAIQVLSDATIAEFKQVHGKIPESEFAILGLGRAGGGVLTHASDLDLVFLFSGDHSAESDGERAMGATRYYIRLCQRVTAALSVPTAEGALYEIDTRLRPSGEQGPPAASFDGFRRYQEEQAWTWEHMALTRARVLYGSPQARSALGEILGRVLTMKRDPDKLRANLLEMRATIAEHKLPKGTLDIKLARGGLVDLEFLVQFFQLRDGCALTPDLGEAVRALVGEGLLDEALVEAHDCMTRFLVAAQLFAPDSQIPLPAARETLAKACRYGEWEMVLSKLHAARSQVALAWQTAFDEILEVST